MTAEGAYLDEHGDPRALHAELADLRAQIRHLADDLQAESLRSPLIPRDKAAERLRAIVGPWPHEKEAAA